MSNARFVRSGTIVLCAALSAGADAAHFVPLGHLLGRSQSKAAAVSGDGTVVVGDSSGRAFRWTADSGMLDLGIESQESVATGVSFDGSVVVGTSALANSPGLVWTEGEGINGIPLTPHDVSGDGRIVVGRRVGPSPRQAARWTREEGVQSLNLPWIRGWDGATATAISADGRVIVGEAEVLPNAVPIRWSEVSGGHVLFDYAPSADRSATVVRLGLAVSLRPRGRPKWSRIGS